MEQSSFRTLSLSNYTDIFIHQNVIYYCSITLSKSLTKNQLIIRRVLLFLSIYCTFYSSKKLMNLSWNHFQWIKISLALVNDLESFSNNLQQPLQYSVFQCIG